MKAENPSLFDEPVAHARTGDRQTSHDAARGIRDLTGKQAAVLDCIRRAARPVADVEWIEEYRRLRWVTGWPMQSESGLRTRRSELFELKLVDAAGERHINHRNHTLWKAVA